MQNIAKGTFEVKATPVAGEGDGQDPLMGRLVLDKEFKGDLEAKSMGQMLAAQTEVKGSAGYVAVEKVTGSLKGLTGSFVFLHKGTMNAGSQELSVTVVPDSGTGQLKGLSGSLKIIIEGGKHFYEFNYELPS